MGHKDVTVTWIETMCFFKHCLVFDILICKRYFRERLLEWKLTELQFSCKVPIKSPRLNRARTKTANVCLSFWFCYYVVSTNYCAKWASTWVKCIVYSCDVKVENFWQSLWLWSHFRDGRVKKLCVFYWCYSSSLKNEICFKCTPCHSFLEIRWKYIFLQFFAWN